MLLRAPTTAFVICLFNMGTDFKEDNIVNPLPQRMVHHTNHNKEYTCLLKGRKEKCTLLFFVCFKKFDQVARRCLAWLCTVLLGLPGRTPGSGLAPGHCYLEPLPSFSPIAPLPLNLPLEPSSLCLRVSALQDTGGLRSTWPCRQPGLWHQTRGQCHCCPDFFSFWKLKLVRLFSFLCF